MGEGGKGMRQERSWRSLRRTRKKMGGAIPRVYSVREAVNLNQIWVLEEMTRRERET